MEAVKDRNAAAASHTPPSEESEKQEGVENVENAQDEKGSAGQSKQSGEDEKESLTNSIDKPHATKPSPGVSQDNVKTSNSNPKSSTQKSALVVSLLQYHPQLKLSDDENDEKLSSKLMPYFAHYDAGIPPATQVQHFWKMAHVLSCIRRCTLHCGSETLTNDFLSVRDGCRAMSVALILQLAVAAPDPKQLHDPAVSFFESDSIKSSETTSKVREAFLARLISPKTDINSSDSSHQNPPTPQTTTPAKTGFLRGTASLLTSTAVWGVTSIMSKLDLVDDPADYSPEQLSSIQRDMERQEQLVLNAHSQTNPAKINSHIQKSNKNAQFFNLTLAVRCCHLVLRYLPVYAASNPDSDSLGIMEHLQLSRTTDMDSVQAIVRRHGSGQGTFHAFCTDAGVYHFDRQHCVETKTNHGQKLADFPPWDYANTTTQTLTEEDYFNMGASHILSTLTDSTDIVEMILQVLIASGHALLSKPNQKDDFTVEGQIVGLRQTLPPSSAEKSPPYYLSDLDLAAYRLSEAASKLEERMDHWQGVATTAGSKAIQAKRAANKSTKSKTNSSSVPLHHMRRRAQALAEVEKCRAAYLNVEMTASALRSAMNDKAVFEGLRVAREAASCAHGKGSAGLGVDVEDVEDMLEDLREGMDQSSLFFSDGGSGSFGGGTAMGDEAGLEQELEALSLQDEPSGDAAKENKQPRGGEENRGPKRDDTAQDDMTNKAYSAESEVDLVVPSHNPSDVKMTLADIEKKRVISS